MSSWQDLKERVTVSQVLELCGIDPPERVPGLIHCPLHDDGTPSLNIDETLWYCHGCGKGGDIFNFVQALGSTSAHAAHLLERAFAGDLEGMPKLGPRVEAPPADFREAWKSTIRYPTFKAAWRPESRTNLFAWLQQKWPDGLVQVADLERWDCRLDKWNLFIPHYAPTGELSGVKVRCMVPPNIGAKSAVKGSQFRQLYRVAPARNNRVVVCEGESDTWTMAKHLPYTSGYDVVGLPGVQSWSKHLDEIKLYAEIHTFLDDDKPSNQVTLQLAEAIPGSKVHRITGGKDVTEAYAAGWLPRP